MNKKKVITITIVSFLLVFTIASIYILKPKKKEKLKEKLNITQEEMVEKIENINDNMNSSNVDIESVSKSVGYQVGENVPFLGPNSLYEFKLPAKVKKGQNYAMYEKIQDEHVQKLEKLVQENFSYEIVKHVTTEYSVIDTVKVRSFYAVLYSMDQNEIMQSILQMGGYDPAKLQQNDKWQVAYYKAKIKSMQILDPYLDFYVNKDEYITFNLIYDMTDKGLVCFNCNTYFELLKAYNSQKFSFDTEENTNKFYEEQKMRIQGYIDAAVSKGILDKNHPFDVK